ncbi:molybdopterin converting factor subunit 1 [Aquisediminimonas profunda]|uniref:molybdopterin converting factor subunit 1 n=1 Tax=Aquisediminimonas profunda TaxID=1550733 RepID=UPI001FEA9E62|nr:molybdopterin converting factor subunit 1 [Aquisediminimonas profunda]
MADVTLLYFASIREKLGREMEERVLPESARTVHDLIEWLVTQDANYASAFAEPAKLRCAIDQVMAPLDAPLAGAREIAFFPPVTGG